MEKNWKYKGNYIAHKKSLLMLLDISESKFEHIINNKEKYYLRKIIVGKNNKPRITYKVIEPLLSIHKKIKARILSNIILPEYIVGGVKNCSYTKDSNNHTLKKTVIVEDISNFFPSISEDLVSDTFQYQFNFSPVVSSMLARIVTLDNGLVQGSILSTDISNIIFLESESQVTNSLQEMGLLYSRYVDDITISSKHRLSNEEITRCKELIYGMIRGKNLYANRKKSMVMHKGNQQLVHNVKVNNGLKPIDKRKNNLRMEMYNFGKMVNSTDDVMTLLQKYRRIRGLINTLTQQGDNSAGAHLHELKSHLSNIDTISVKKTIRTLRKTKNLKQLAILKGKLKPLLQVKPGMKTILDAEYATMKRKLILREI